MKLRIPSLFRALFRTLLLALLPVGCASLDRPATLTTEQADCWEAFSRLDAELAGAHLHDEGEHRLPGYPYLRSNRLLASFADELDHPAQHAAWLARLAALDRQARHLELRRLHGDAELAKADAERLDGCRETLLAHDRHHPQRLGQLGEASQVPDDYLMRFRLLGLYPLSALGIRLGIHRWHRQTQATFATPLDELPRFGTLSRWASPHASTPTPATTARWLARSRDPLGIPWPDPAQQDQLLARHAPLWEVDVHDENDLVGGFRWQQGPLLDPARPTEYRLLSHTRFGEEVLLQLNYLIWFPARPGRDIYAGWLDGVHWRVTLGNDGEPLIYDSIHPCGCYHLFFPTSRVQWREGQPRGGLEEPPLSPQQAPRLTDSAQRLVVRISHGRHYIERVYLDDSTSPAIPLKPLPYDTLRALPGEAGYHSLFGRHGLIPGSERLERLLFWPMGIRSAGAMRQWGRHPSAFIGRRHFDDAHLFDELFAEPRP